MEKKNGRSVILEAAAKVFADKGYEGARVDEIAKEAGVTKSLLYYHFKSKAEIFEVLVDDLMREYRNIMQTIKDEQCSYESDDLKGRMQSKIFPFGLEYENLVRCAFIESLKRENACNVFFQMVELRKEEGNPKMMEQLVLEYFFNILPCIVFLCQKEAWCDYFHMEPDKLGEIFLNQYDNVHGAWHRKEESNHD